MAQNEKIDELYSQLREADSLAQKGDKQAATDAQQIYNYIQELSRENFVETPRILGGAIGVGAGAGVKGLQMIPTGISKAGQLFGQAAAKEMLASGMSPDAVEKWYYNSSNYKKFGIPYQEAINYKHAHALAQPQVNAFLDAKKLEPLNALFPTLPPTIPTTGAPPSAPPITKPSMVNSIMNAPMRGLEKVGSAVAPYASAAGKFLNPMAALGGAGYAGVDMYNRGKTGDTTGENIAMVGALGSLASMAPHPLVKGVGTGVALSAEALNAYRDKLRRGEIVHGGAQQNVDASGNAYSTGGLVHLKKK